jgi:ADP-heptose:LPS heptosyltransferase
MLSLLRRLRSTEGDPRVLRLIPEWGFGDHLMLAAIIEGLTAEHPELRIRVAADHPEIFWHNPHVEEVVSVARLRKRDPRRLAGYRLVTRRPPPARYLQVTGHLLDDMYDSIGIPIAHRPQRPKIYLTRLEERFRRRTLTRLPRPRVAIAPHGPPGVRLPNKVYPLPQWQELAPQLTEMAGSLLQIGRELEGPLLPGAEDHRDIGIRRTASVLRHCDLLLTHVGGMMHLAAAVGVPSVVLYGAAEHPAISGYPWNYNLYTPIECGPCWMEDLCSHHSCMRGLTPARVVEEVRAALGSAPPGMREIPVPVLTAPSRLRDEA